MPCASGTKRKGRRVGQRVELIFRDIAAAARVQRADPVNELVHVRRSFCCDIRNCSRHIATPRNPRT